MLNMKMLAKTLNKSAQKCEKEEKSERLKVKSAIQKGNVQGARIYCQNAIRKKNEMLNYMVLSSRLDAVVSRLKSQMMMQMVTQSMSGIVKTLGSALASNNLEKVAVVMNTFEKQFEDLDIQNGVVNRVMGGQAALSTPEAEVEALMQAVAAEHGLEQQLIMPSAGKSALPNQQRVQDAGYAARVASLRS
ncbi:MAG: hypothetical protein WDW38_008654 [Sanguina aurantia]